MVSTPLLLHYIVKKKYQLLTNVEPEPSAFDTRRDVMAHSIANSVHAYTDIFLLTLFSSPQIVSVYSVYSLPLNGLTKMQAVFTTGLEGAFGTLWAGNEKERFKKNFETYEYVMYCFVAVVFACAAILLLPFIRIYTKGIHDANYILPIYAVLAVVTQGMFCLRTPYITAVQAAGKYKETKKGAYFEAGFNLCISLLLVPKYGLIGVTLGTLLANIIRTIQFAIFLSDHLLYRKKTELIKRFIWLCGNIVIIIVFWNYIDFPMAQDWSTWLIGGGVSFLISLLTVFIMSIIFFRKEVINVYQIIKGILEIKVTKS